MFKKFIKTKFTFEFITFDRFAREFDHSLNVVVKITYNHKRRITGGIDKTYIFHAYVMKKLSERALHRYKATKPAISVYGPLPLESFKH